MNAGGDAMLLASLEDVVEGIGLNTFVNADKARAMGFELEVMALPVPEVMLSGTYSYNNTEFNEFFTKDANACTLGPRAAWQP